MASRFVLKAASARQPDPCFIGIADSAADEFKWMTARRG
jgi:hypothetical protein